MNPDDLFEDFELLIIEALRGDSSIDKEQATKEFIVFLTQIYRVSRDPSLAEENRGRARGKLIALLGSLQHLHIPTLRKEIPPITGATSIIESNLEHLSASADPYTLLLYTNEFPLSLLLAVSHFNRVIDIASPRADYVRDYFGSKRFDTVRCLFHPSLALETRQNISATTEPFTPLVIIDPYIALEDRDYRDHGSIVFDILLQLTFLDTFKRARGKLNRERSRAKMYQVGAQYAEDLFFHFLNVGVTSKRIDYRVDEGSLKIIPKGDSAATADYVAYCLYLAESLYRNAEREVMRLTGTYTAAIQWPHALVKHTVSLIT